MVRLFAFCAAVLVATNAHAVMIISNAIEDTQYIQGNQADRFEQILGQGRSRFGAVRFDTAPIAPFVGGTYNLLSAKLVLTEEGGRDTTHNGSQTADVGALFLRTAENADWTATMNPTGGWHGNSQARPGDVGSPGGDNNVDPRSTNEPVQMAGNTFLSGVNQTTHTFRPGVLDVVEIDLTEAGGALNDIMSILADWVGGNNAGLGLTAEVGGQIMFRSVGTAAGTEGGTGVGLPGILADGSTPVTAAGGVTRLELEFELIPEPSTLAMVGMAVTIAGLRRKRS